jgi:hypothetical protein
MICRASFGCACGLLASWFVVLHAHVLSPSSESSTGLAPQAGEVTPVTSRCGYDAYDDDDDETMTMRWMCCTGCLGRKKPADCSYIHSSTADKVGVIGVVTGPCELHADVHRARCTPCTVHVHSMQLHLQVLPLAAGLLLVGT